ncbi:TIGR03086 family metal-binding protein [Nocardia transvalensis]|uniref:TIGR03086 family metal-binding protein n=1 Tax=Nocardia transvalensis TaxID=37333 RepID=UPI001894448F|nr:TIGR03086 family metal-binding protein [Nocardia transvalensis]MBF6330942.1 TIGR03086 family protein [Nocardia transvalensis]
MSITPQTADDPATALAPVWRDVLIASHRALVDVVAGIGHEQWRLPTPCSQWTVTQVIQHAAADQRAYARALGVGSGPEYDPFAPSGTITGLPAALVATAVDEAAAAWATVTDPTAPVPTPLPHGALPASVAAVLCALDAAVHAWDIAAATGQRSPLTDDLAAALLLGAGGLIEPLRQYGVYDPAVAGDPTDTPVDQLLRYLGRDPRG